MGNQFLSPGTLAVRSLRILEFRSFFSMSLLGSGSQPALRGQRGKSWNRDMDRFIQHVSHCVILCHIPMVGCLFDTFLNGETKKVRLGFAEVSFFFTVGNTETAEGSPSCQPDWQ